MIKDGTHKGITFVERSNFFSGNFLFEVKNAVGNPINKAIIVEPSAISNVYNAVFIIILF